MSRLLLSRLQILLPQGCLRAPRESQLIKALTAHRSYLIPMGLKVSGKVCDRDTVQLGPGEKMKGACSKKAREENILKRKGRFEWLNVIEVTKRKDWEEATGLPHLCQLEGFGRFLRKVSVACLGQNQIALTWQNGSWFGFIEYWLVSCTTTLIADYL